MNYSNYEDKIIKGRMVYINLDEKMKKNKIKNKNNINNNINININGNIYNRKNLKNIFGPNQRYI